MGLSQKFDLKYRPLTFDALVGQPVPARYVRQLARQNKARNLLAQGPTGCGKTSLARIYGRALNCLDLLPDGNPCNFCIHCTLQLTNRFPDYREQNTGKEGGKDAILDFLDSVQTPPIAGRYLVRVIDEAQALSKAAQETLKKVMEEPPPHLVIILTTTEIAGGSERSSILPDIRDRCQPVVFRRISHIDAVAHLQWICDQEGLPYERPALDLIAFLTEGHLRPLVGKLEQLADFGDISFATARQVFNLGYIEHLPRLWRHLLGGDLPAALGVLDSWEDEPERVVDIWREFLLWLQCRFVHHAEIVINPVFAALPTADVRGIVDVLTAQAKTAGIGLEDALAALAKVLGLAQAYNPLGLKLLTRDLYNLLHFQGLDPGRVGAAVTAAPARPANAPAAKKPRQLAAAYVIAHGGVARPADEPEQTTPSWLRAPGAVPYMPPPVMPSGQMAPGGFAPMPFAPPPGYPGSMGPPGFIPPSPSAHFSLASTDTAPSWNEPADETDKPIRVPAGMISGSFPSMPEPGAPAELPPSPPKPVYPHDLLAAGWTQEEREIRAVFPQPMPVSVTTD